MTCPVLACGAELKNTFCLTRDRNAFLCQHIGDLENLETLEHFEASIDALRSASSGCTPEVIAYDLHPEYLATKYALARCRARPAARRRLEVSPRATASITPLGGAHTAMLPGRESDTRAPGIGVSMDGLGYGADGALWGGEVLLCDLEHYRRFAHLEYLPLPGGALAIRRAGAHRGRLAARAAGRRRRWQRALRPASQLDDAEARGGGRPGGVRSERAAHLELRPPVRRGRRAGRRARGRHLRRPGRDRARDGLGGRRRPYRFEVEGEPGRGAGGGDASGPPPARILRRRSSTASCRPRSRRPPAFVGSRLHASLAAIIVRRCAAARAAGAPPSSPCRAASFRTVCSATSARTA